MAPDLTPHALDDEDVLYATPTRAYRSLLHGTVRAIQVLAVVLLVITGSAAIWALVASERSDGALFAVVMVIPALGSLLLLALTPPDPSHAASHRLRGDHRRAHTHTSARAFAARALG